MVLVLQVVRSPSVIFLVEYIYIYKRKNLITRAPDASQAASLAPIVVVTILVIHPLPFIRVVAH